MKMIVVKSISRYRLQGFYEGRIVTVLQEQTCPDCGLTYCYLQEFPDNLGKIPLFECICESIVEIEYGPGYNYVPARKDWLAPIDDQETKDAFEKLNALDKIKKKVKV
jgi:hypothetical protein